MDLPLLFSYLLFGGFDLGLGTADAYLGDGFRVIAPSRFGYLGSSLQAGATLADQADAYAALLDALGVERTAVVGFSAGGRRRSSSRCGTPTGPAGWSCCAPRSRTGRATPKPVAQLLFGSDLVFWRLKAYLPSLYARLLGMPRASSDPRGAAYDLGGPGEPVPARTVCQPSRTRRVPPNASLGAVAGGRAGRLPAARQSGPGRPGGGTVPPGDRVGWSARPSARWGLGHQLAAELPCPLLELRVQLAGRQALWLAFEVRAGGGGRQRRGDQRGDALAGPLR